MSQMFRKKNWSPFTEEFKKKLKLLKNQFKYQEALFTNRL